VLATDFVHDEHPADQADGSYGPEFTDEALALTFRLRKA